MRPLPWLIGTAMACAWGSASAEVPEFREGPFVVHRLIADPHRPGTVLALTSNYGVMKSENGGATWALSNRGLRGYTHHALIQDPGRPEMFFAGGWGAGVSVSVDGGGFWTERNDGLGNTAVEALARDPADAETLFAATTTGVFRSPDGGRSWVPWSEGLPLSTIAIFSAVLAVPDGAVPVWLGTDRGLFRRGRGAAAWSPAEGPAGSTQITVLAQSPDEGDLWAGTVRRGLWRSSNGGMEWSPVEALGPVWVSDIVFPPGDGNSVTVSTRAHGIWTTADGGRSWTALDPSGTGGDIRSLAYDPGDPAVLYAGTTYSGVLKTLNGGRSWKTLSGYPSLTMGEIIATFPPAAPRAEKAPPSPPPGFVKCNACHGWVDPQLNTKTTYWRMAVNRRNWGATVDRMAARAQLTPPEAESVVRFLEEYTGSESWSENPKQTVRRICGGCHALRIREDCVAGDCGGNRTVRLAGPAPWDRVLDWMGSMGAVMTPRQAFRVEQYLRGTYPFPPEALAWERVSVGEGAGGWNVVSLFPGGDALYAGFEGNGKIFRSVDGERWTEAAATGRYTVYGLTPFGKSLYAGANDPDPQIWKQDEEGAWVLAAALPPEDRGVIALGVFKGRLYAGTGRGWIYRSSDGSRWEKAASLGGFQRPEFGRWVRFILEFKGQLYAGLEAGGLYRSADGRAWKAVETGAAGRTGVRGAAVFRGALYVGSTGGGAVRRTRDGEQWEEAFRPPAGITRGYVASMAATPDRLFAGVDGRVFQSPDGLHWEEAGHLGPYTVEALAVYRGRLYAGASVPPSGRIYRAVISP